MSSGDILSILTFIVPIFLIFYFLLRKKTSNTIMFVIGIVLMLGGITLSIVQLALKEGPFYQLDRSYLYVGIVLVIVGALFVTGVYIAKSFRQTGTSMPEQTRSQESTDNAASIPEQIEQLAKLKEQGILSELEFEEKKRELLSRM